MRELRKIKENRLDPTKVNLKAFAYWKRMAHLTQNIEQIRQIMSDPMYESLNTRLGSIEEGPNPRALKARLAHLKDERMVLADQRRFLMNQKNWLLDQRNKHGTGPLISISPYTGKGLAVYFIEWDAQTACPLNNFKLEGDEVTCDPSHRVVRHWKDGNLVSRTAKIPVRRKGGRE